MGERVPVSRQWNGTALSDTRWALWFYRQRSPLRGIPPSRDDGCHARRGDPLLRSTTLTTVGLEASHAASMPLSHGILQAGPLYLRAARLGTPLAVRWTLGGRGRR